MPIYEFQCLNCGMMFEDLVLRRSDTDNVSCKKCQSKHVQRLMSGAAIVSSSPSSICTNQDTCPLSSPHGNCCSGKCNH